MNRWTDKFQAPFFNWTMRKQSQTDAVRISALQIKLKEEESRIEAYQKSYDRCFIELILMRMEYFALSEKIKQKEAQLAEAKEQGDTKLTACILQKKWEWDNEFQVLACKIETVKEGLLEARQEIIQLKREVYQMGLMLDHSRGRTGTWTKVQVEKPPRVRFETTEFYLQ
jgi:chromosome segregation ATPase